MGTYRFFLEKCKKICTFEKNREAHAKLGGVTGVKPPLEGVGRNEVRPRGRRPLKTLDWNYGATMEELCSLQKLVWQDLLGLEKRHW